MHGDLGWYAKDDEVRRACGGGVRDGRARVESVCEHEWYQIGCGRGRVERNVCEL